jgi:hypothetical protein
VGAGAGAQPTIPAIKAAVVKEIKKMLIILMYMTFAISLYH